MDEDKQLIVDALRETLKLTRGGGDIEKMTYVSNSYSEVVLIRFKNGFSKAVNVACDSGIAMIRDILKEI